MDWKEKIDKVVADMPLPKAKIRSTKWYGRFWPPERRKVKLMQAILEHYAPQYESSFAKTYRDFLLYGKPPN